MKHWFINLCGRTGIALTIDSVFFSFFFSPSIFSHSLIRPTLARMHAQHRYCTLFFHRYVSMRILFYFFYFCVLVVYFLGVFFPSRHRLKENSLIRRLCVLFTAGGKFRCERSQSSQVRIECFKQRCLLVVKLLVYFYFIFFFSGGGVVKLSWLVLFFLLLFDNLFLNCGILSVTLSD